MHFTQCTFPPFIMIFLVDTVNRKTGCVTVFMLSITHLQQGCM